MADTVLYIAASLDGYIAREDGSLDWLENLPNPDQTDHGYAEFLESVGTVVMGRTTYEQVLGFGGEWPYATMDTKVVTSRMDFNVGTPSTEVVHHIDATWLEGLRKQTQDTWIVGGGKVIARLLDIGGIDVLRLFVIPVVLGRGIPLFPAGSVETKFTLTGTKAHSTGAVELTYRSVR